MFVLQCNVLTLLKYLQILFEMKCIKIHASFTIVLVFVPFDSPVIVWAQAANNGVEEKSNAEGKHHVLQESDSQT